MTVRLLAYLYLSLLTLKSSVFCGLQSIVFYLQAAAFEARYLYLAIVNVVIVSCRTKRKMRLIFYDFLLRWIGIEMEMEMGRGRRRRRGQDGTGRGGAGVQKKTQEEKGEGRGERGEERSSKPLECQHCRSTLGCASLQQISSRSFSRFQASSSSFPKYFNRFILSPL